MYSLPFPYIFSKQLLNFVSHALSAKACKIELKSMSVFSDEVRRSEQCKRES
jgi:hypothetical protein